VTNLKELVGMLIIFTDVNFFCWWGIGFGLTTKGKIKNSLKFEAYILAICIGAYLLGS
jgi:hypothetical protein